MSSLLLLPLRGFGQPLFNDNFQVFGCPDSPCTSGFITNANDCLPPWFISHGTPHVRADDPFDTHSNRYLCMTYNQDNLGEGTFRILENEAEFLACNMYALEFRIRTLGMPNPGNANYQIALTNGLSPAPVILPDPPCAGAIPQPSPVQVIFSQPAGEFPVSAGWQYFSCRFVPNQNFSQLWVTATATGVEGTVVNMFCIDDLSITLEGPVEQASGHVSYQMPSVVCPGSLVELGYRICNAVGLSATTYTVQAGAFPAGLSLAPGSDNPVVGSTSDPPICGLNGNCTNVKFQVLVAPNQPPGVYTIPLSIGVQSAHGCFSGWTDEMKIEVLDCPVPEYDCDCPAGIPQVNIFPYPGFNVVDLSDLIMWRQILPAGALSGHCLRIKGQLRIDMDYSFDNCLFRMDPGAEIVVHQNAQLWIDQSLLSGCTAMWRGVRVLSGGVLTLTNDTILDAQYAIHAVPGPFTFVYAVGNQFDNNFVGAFVAEHPFTSLTSLFEVNEFTQSAGTLLPPFSGQSSAPENLPEQNQHALAGIIVNTVSAFTSLSNTFSGICSGIVSRNTNFASSKDTYVRITGCEDFYPSWEFGGKAVSIRSSGVHPALVEHGVFEACVQGISSGFAPLAARYNQMTQVNQGIFASMAQPGNIVVEHNEIEDALGGFFVAHAHPEGSVSMEHNEISTDTENASAGIVLLFNQAPAKLMENHVRIKEAGSGILVFDARRATLHDNTVEIDNPGAAEAGIDLQHLRQSLLETNTVRGAGTGGPANIALRITSSPGNVYCCNTLDNTRLGARISGGSLATDNFRGTAFSNHNTSLLLPNVNAVLGTQTHMQNRWLQDAGPAVYDVLSDFAENYPFIVDVSSANGDPTYEPEEFSPETWFQFETNPEDEDECDVEICMVNEFAPESDDVKRIAMGDTTVAPAVMWELQRYIYERLQGETVQNASILHFLAQSDTNAIGAFYSISKGIEALFAADTTAVALLKANLANAEEKLDSIVLIDLALPEADSAEAASLWASRGQLVSDLSVLAEDNALLAQDLADAYSSEAEKLRSQNDSIVVATDYEYNEKAVNEIYLSRLAALSFMPDSAEVALLESIAGQCPFIGGNAVYRARAFLMLLTGDAAVYDDSLACLPVQALTAPPDIAISQAIHPTRELKIYPNPTQGEVDMLWNEAVGQSGRISIFDLFGRQIQQIHVPVGSMGQNLSLRHLPEGMYVIRTWLDNQEFVNKLVIKH